MTSQPISQFRSMFFNEGDYLEFPNARIVYVGNGMVQTYRRYRNILTNEMSDWQPSREGHEKEPKPMTDAMADEWMNRK